MTAAEPLQAEQPRHPERNVTRFLESQYGGIENSRWKLAYHRGNFYEWQGSRWRTLDKETLESYVYTVFKNAVYADGEGNPQPFPCSPGNMDAIMRGLRNETLVDRDVNIPAWLEGNIEVQPALERPLPAREVIACKNCLLHASSEPRVFGHTPRFFNVTSVNYDYLPEAPSPESWLSFLSDLWPDDSESVDTLQEIFGYCLTSRTDLQKMFMLIGPPRSGKGTIVRVLTALLGGDTSVTSVSLADLNQRFGLEHLENKQLGIMQDARFRSRDDGVAVERLLSITGEDEVSIDKKGKGLYAAKLPTRFLLVSNELPVMQDESGALRSRILVLKTLDTVSEDKRNSRLFETFVSELPAILNWALRGLERLNRREVFVQPKSAREDADIMSHLSSSMESFVDDYLVSDTAQCVRRDEVYLVYERWCKEAGVRPRSRDVLGKDLRSKFPRMYTTQNRENNKRVRFYHGIGLNDAAQEIISSAGFVDGL